jgi:hypothetical protein
MADAINYMRLIPSALIHGALLAVYLMLLSAVLAGALPQIFVAISASLAIPFIVTLATGIAIIQLVRPYLPSVLYNYTKLP